MLLYTIYGQKHMPTAMYALLHSLSLVVRFVDGDNREHEQQRVVVMVVTLVTMATLAAAAAAQWPSSSQAREDACYASHGLVPLMVADSLPDL